MKSFKHQKKLNYQAIILIEYLQKGHRETGQHYSRQLKRLREPIKEKRQRKLTKGILFHQDIAPAHTSMVAMTTIHDCGFELTPIHFICQTWGHMTEISSFALITSFFLRGANERNTR